MGPRKKRAPGYQKERSERQKARIMAALKQGAMTAQELADSLHLGLPQIHRYLNRMRAADGRCIHVCGFAFREEGSGLPRNQYGVGSLPDLHLPTFQKARLVVGLETFGRPASVVQIAAWIGMDCDKARRYVRQLRKENRIHIASWTWADKASVPMYAAGEGDDTPKPSSNPKAAPRPAPAGSVIFAALGL